MIDIKLKTFITLASLKNYSKTAEVLHLTQPAVTQHIQSLEKYYGTKLFDRQGKGLKLSYEGEMLLNYATKVLSMSKAVERTMKNSNDIKKNYNIGASLTIGEFILPKKLSDFMIGKNNYCVSMEVKNTKDIIKLLINEEIELGVVEGAFNKQYFEHKLWMKDKLVLVIHPNHPFAKLDEVNLKDILNENLIVREKGSGTRALFEKEINKREIDFEKFSKCIEIGNPAAIKKLIKNNIGVSILSEKTVEEEVNLKELKSIEIIDLNLEREFNFIYYKEHPARIFIDMFIKFCIGNKI